MSHTSLAVLGGTQWGWPHATMGAPATTVGWGVPMVSSPWSLEVWPAQTLAILLGLAKIAWVLLVEDNGKQVKVPQQWHCLWISVWLNTNLTPLCMQQSKSFISKGGIICFIEFALRVGELKQDFFSLDIPCFFAMLKHSLTGCGCTVGKSHQHSPSP